MTKLTLNVLPNTYFSYLHTYHLYSTRIDNQQLHLHTTLFRTRIFQIESNTNKHFKRKNLSRKKMFTATPYTIIISRATQRNSAWQHFLTANLSGSNPVWRLPSSRETRLVPSPPSRIYQTSNASPWNRLTPPRASTNHCCCGSSSSRRHYFLMNKLIPYFVIL